MSPVLALAVFLLAAVLGFVGAWLYDRHLRSFPVDDVITPKLYRAGNVNVHLTVVLLVILQCGGYAPGEGTTFACGSDLSIELEKRTKRAVVVYAKFSAFCDPAPQSHNVLVELKHRERKNGPWANLVSRSSDRISEPQMSVIRGTSFVCLPGYWKAYARVWGTSTNGKPFTKEHDQKLRWGTKIRKRDCRWT